MGTGPTGTNGVTVLSVVVAECRNDQGPVAILRRRLVESHALGGVWNPDNAMQSLVQVRSFSKPFKIYISLTFLGVQLFCLIIKNNLKILNHLRVIMMKALLLDF